MSEVTPALKNPDGTLTHVVTGPFQEGETRIHVLLPDEVESSDAHRVLYLLPVEPQDGQQCGDPVEEVRRLDLHNKHRVICVKPTFSHAPWYADHPTNPHVRQESHILSVVVPFVDETYLRSASAPQRLLVGFSKSGWGACSLLLRHPTTFSRAAVFDAPLAWETPNRYGMGDIFETQANMDLYCVNLLIEQVGPLVSGTPRLAMYGYSDFRGHHQFLHYRLLKLGIPHVFVDGEKRAHRWDSGWLAPAFDFLAGCE